MVLYSFLGPLFRIHFREPVFVFILNQTMKNTIFSLLFFFSFLVLISAQKRAIDHPDFDIWNGITGNKISNDGNWIIYHLKPGKGDQTLKITDNKGEEIASFERGVKAEFSFDSRYVVFMIKPHMDSVNALRRKKVKKNKLPKDTLAVFDLKKKSLHKIPRVLSFSVPEKWNGWITYKADAILPPPKDTAKSDSTVTKPKVKKKKAKKVSEENGFHIIWHNLKNQSEDTLKYVLNLSLAFGN